MKSSGSCMAGGSLSVRGIPTPPNTIRHADPTPVERKPLPARADGTRQYVRRWAVSHGFHVATVGAIPKKVHDAYAEALR